MTVSAFSLGCLSLLKAKFLFQQASSSSFYFQKSQNLELDCEIFRDIKLKSQVKYVMESYILKP